jgi:hypothetical protein
LSDKSKALVDLLNRIDGELAQAAALADAIGVMSSGLVANRYVIGDLITALKTQ